MKANDDITDRARTDDFTALVEDIARWSRLGGVMCVRRIEPGWEDEDGVHPPSVVYEARRKSVGVVWPATVTFDVAIASCGCVEDVIRMELDKVFGP